MTQKSGWKYLAMTALFMSIGLTMFTENVRTVQVLGLFASGMVCGVFLDRAIAAFRSGSAAAGTPSGPGRQ